MTNKKTKTIIKTHQQIYNQQHSIVLMMETINEAALLVDPYQEGHPIIFVNRGFTEMTGYTKTEITGREYTTLEGKGTDKKVSQIMIDAMKHEQNATVETLNYRKDGTSFWIEMNLSPLYNEYGEIYAFIGIQKDVTSKKQAITNQTTFFDEHGHHDAYITFVNSQGIYEKMNQDILGFKKIEDNNMIGKPMIDFVIDEDKEKVMHIFNRALKGYIENLFIRGFHYNGDVIEINILYIPSYNQGKINGVYTIFRNVTGYFDTNRLMINAEKYDVAKRMALTIADTLDTPLTTLKGFIQLLETKSPFASEYTKLMLTEITRIEKTTIGARHLSKLRMIRTQNQNLHMILKNVCEIMYTSTLKENIQLHLNYKTKKEQVEIDRKGIEYIFIQLIKNAVESMPLGGNVFIEVKYQPDDMILIHFIDEGIGIEKHNIEQVKEPFFTTKENRVGIALTLCENIINEHKGSLTLKNRKKKGIVAEVRIPTFS